MTIFALHEEKKIIEGNDCLIGTKLGSLISIDPSLWNIS